MGIFGKSIYFVTNLMVETDSDGEQDDDPTNWIEVWELRSVAPLRFFMPLDMQLWLGDDLEFFRLGVAFAGRFILFYRIEKQCILERAVLFDIVGEDFSQIWITP